MLVKLIPARKKQWEKTARWVEQPLDHGWQKDEGEGDSEDGVEDADQLADLSDRGDVTVTCSKKLTTCLVIKDFVFFKIVEEYFIEENTNATKSSKK